ncbi:hypothetical protein ERX46_14140 [Brumimicrobium glaciale]|uniref:Uncharacterized protein n=1 Tax=Brumimicrobium glaciale TaxID=200475 RepID=A0A4Q4KGR6_9FLAO|nr:hypothetical protein [Brumimicrobium glaciale]RYM32413.1 hypothetical protein ERX46_14140 [Brumimicrobium glaciale]
MVSIVPLRSQTSNLRWKTITPENDTLIIDSLTIYQNSFKVFCGDSLLDKSAYYFDGNSRKFLSKTTCLDTLQLRYRVFSIDFQKPYQTIDTSMIYQNVGKIDDFFFRSEDKPLNFFSDEGIKKSGSISRGISFGNSQDLSVNSTLNLQLSGEISNNMNILATVTDDNLPIQPDGNTNQIQEFDQVFIQLYGKEYKIIAGDFWLKKPTGYFTNYNKRAQGLYGQYSWGEEKAKWTIQGAGALSKGKFSRNEIQGMEGSQGPYRLKGNENEPFIMVLSGTEKVYLDGRLLERGQEYDYVINYNSSELVFTPRNQITKDTRIVVEFQYTDQNYARSLFQASATYESEKFDFWLNMFSEQDAKNQSLQQKLSNKDKLLLSKIGDSLDLARTQSIDSVGFLDNQVTYKLMDSLGIDSVLVYSVSPDSAFYRATFTNVGIGNGNYIFDRFTAVGRVYKWVAPIGGVPQGDFEPTRLIVTPKKNAMISAGINYRFNKKWKIMTEMSTTNNDKNTFSRVNNEDNRAFANKTTIDGLFNLRNDSTSMWELSTGLDFEYRTQYFKEIERYRGVEFDRDWNVRNRKYEGQEVLAHISGGIKHKKFGGVELKAQNFTLGEEYQGNRGQLLGDWKKNGFEASLDGSYLRANADGKNTYLRHKSKLSQEFGKIKIGFEDDHELNQFELGDTLLRTNSYQWYDWKVYLANADTLQNKFTVFYRERYDWKSDSSRLVNAAKGRSVGADYNWVTNKTSSLTTLMSYRMLEIKDEKLIDQQPENTFLGRIDYRLNLWKNALTASTFYEVGSGLELKKEFLYIEVNAGQGVYTWIDYNGDGVKDLNEFEIAQYSDQAKYIRVFTPSDEYVRTYSNEFNQTLFWRPERIWKSKGKVLKLLSRFSNQARFRVNRKMSNQSTRTYNPFDRKIADTNLISFNSTIRNTVFFNRTNPVFAADYTYSETGSKTLLASGFDARDVRFNALNFRWNLWRKFTINLGTEEGLKSSSADYTSGRDFSIQYHNIQPELIFQPSTTFRLSLKGRYEEKSNGPEFGGEKAFIGDLGLGLKWNQVEKGSLNAEVKIVSINYSGNQNSALSYEMLESLKPGRNYTWNVNYQRNISKNLQISLQYNGRRSEDSKTIHSGGVEVRAFF